MRAGESLCCRESVAGDLLAYCVAGHHGGLPDGGSAGDGDASLIGRLDRVKCGELPGCSAWDGRIDLTLPTTVPLASMPTASSDAAERLRTGSASQGDARCLSANSVSVYEADRDALLSAGAIEPVFGNAFLLVDEERYREDIGLDAAVAEGEGLYW